MHLSPDLSPALSAREQASIVKAALLAHAGKHAEAEAARFAGNYHNLRDREGRIL